MRPRLGVRDVVPILVAGIAMTLLILLAERIGQPSSAVPASLSARTIALAAMWGVGLTVALAGMQGRADQLTASRGLKGWLAIAICGAVGAWLGGVLNSPGSAVRLAIMLVGTAGVSALLYVLRKRTP